MGAIVGRAGISFPPPLPKIEWERCLGILTVTAGASSTLLLFNEIVYMHV